MKDMDLKKEVLKEIMDLMSQKDGEMLKKHPKIAKVDIASNDPSLAKKLESGMKEAVMEGEEENPMEAMGEADGMDEEKMMKLMELYKKLKA